MSLVCLITAMTAEARPLIESFNLKALPQKGLSAWVGEGVCLVQTGMGQQRAESRIDALLANQLGISAFINVGIAGGKRQLGDVIIASSVHDQLSGKTWYPHLPPSSVLSTANSSTISSTNFSDDSSEDAFADTFENEQASCAVDHCAVISVPEPCEHYRSDCVYDMEASAVINTTSKHTDLSRIQTVKVISDNPDNPLDDFSVKNVTPLMCNTLPLVTALVDWLSAESAARDVQDFRGQVNTLVTHITGLCHHSVTETHQLRRYLERFLALNGELPTLEQLGQLNSSQALLQRLNDELNNHAVNY